MNDRVRDNFIQYCEYIHDKRRRKVELLDEFNEWLIDIIKLRHEQRKYYKSQNGLDDYFCSVYEMVKKQAFKFSPKKIRERGLKLNPSSYVDVLIRCSLLEEARKLKTTTVERGNCNNCIVSKYIKNVVEVN